VGLFTRQKTKFLNFNATCFGQSKWLSTGITQKEVKRESYSSSLLAWNFPLRNVMSALELQHCGMWNVECEIWSWWIAVISVTFTLFRVQPGVCCWLWSKHLAVFKHILNICCAQHARCCFYCGPVNTWGMYLLKTIYSFADAALNL
jgi:hypothetical protein